MSIKKVKLQRMIMEERTVVCCDICKKEVPTGQFDVWRAEKSHSRIWFKKPLDHIAGIIKGSISDVPAEEADFNVHVRCAYKAIDNAIKESNNV